MSPNRIDDDALLEDLRQIAAEVDASIPTRAEYDTHGSYSSQTLVNRFGSWKAALKTADVADRTSGGKIAQDALLDDLRRVADKLDAPPTTQQYDEHGNHARRTLTQHFDGWESALEAAGLDTGAHARGDGPPTTIRISDDALLDDLRRVADVLGHPPTTQHYRDMGNHVPSTVLNRWGRWDQALMEAGLDPRQKQYKAGDAGGMAGAKTAVRCPYCDYRFGTETAESNTVTCLRDECAKEFGWRIGLVAAARGHDGVERLANGPTAESVLPGKIRHGSWPIPREYVCRLRFLPTDNHNTGDDVWYLAGDERAAARVFIRENHEYVADCIEGPADQNPLESGWEVGDYDMLREQYLWVGKSPLGDGATDATDGATDAKFAQQAGTNPGSDA